MLKKICLVSTPLFQRFVIETKAIDRSDRAKFSEEFREVGPTVAHDWISQTQKEYEVKKLRAAFIHWDHVDIQQMSDQKRNDLLDKVNEIDISKLISLTAKNTLQIGDLKKLYTLMNECYPQLESLLLLFDKQENVEEKKWDLLISSFIIIFIFVIYYTLLQ